jgi:hypothetical protein
MVSCVRWADWLILKVDPSHSCSAAVSRRAGVSCFIPLPRHALMAKYRPHGQWSVVTVPITIHTVFLRNVRNVNEVGPWRVVPSSQPANDTENRIPNFLEELNSEISVVFLLVYLFSISLFTCSRRSLGISWANWRKQTSFKIYCLYTLSSKVVKWELLLYQHSKLSRAAIGICIQRWCLSGRSYPRNDTGYL